jgi:CDP-4-dehydro-6-deoxyglucose reductase
MSYKISIKPSGHSFEIEPSETLLQAGLRAGLNLGHNCANGSCGECRARLVSGTVAPQSHFDYRFSELEKEQGWFLMCSCRAAADALIEVHEPGSAAEIPEQQVRAKVSRIEHLQDDVIQLTVRAPRSGGLQFLAGQGVALRFDGLQPQTLPIASCPCDSMQLRFHLRRRAGDPFSAFVFRRLRKGGDVLLQGPCGDFTLDEESSRPLVFVAWESGFAPVSSLIDHAIQKDENRSIDLYWLSSIPRGHYLSNYCRAWRDVLDDFRYHSIDLQPAGGDSLEQVIKRIVRVHALLADHDYYLALPQPGLDIARSLLDDAGVPGARVRSGPMAHP